MRKNSVKLKAMYPEMLNEWHFYYNGLLGIDPDEVSMDHNGQVYWICPACSSTYRMSPKKRCQNKIRNHESCFYCRGRVQLHVFTVALKRTATVQRKEEGI